MRVFCHGEVNICIVDRQWCEIKFNCIIRMNNGNVWFSRGRSQTVNNDAHDGVAQMVVNICGARVECAIVVYGSKVLRVLCRDGEES